MPSVDLVVGVDVVRTPRVMQIEGQFDMAPDRRIERRWHAVLPFDDRDWSIGALIGPSGSGKTSILRHLFGERPPLTWDDKRSVLDSFPQGVPVQEITAALSSVGFSSPPSWLRPFGTLSNGEQFRACLARSLMQSDDPIVVDEFTSVVDRTVARIGSAAVAKHVRARSRKLVVASCHYDIVEWLQPDWVFDTGADSFAWRSLQRRPPLQVTIYRSPGTCWRWFGHHHYLSRTLSRGATCYVGLIEGHPAGFVGVLPEMGSPGMRRETRIVVLPDFQGISLGNAMSELVGSLWTAAGYRYRSVGGHPAIIGHRARSPKWHMDRKPSFGGWHVEPEMRPTGAGRRMTASFEYIGPKATLLEAEALGIVPRTRSSRGVDAAAAASAGVEGS